MLSINISDTCPHNMVNFGPLAAEIGAVVWDTPANFNGFRVLAALLHGTLGRQPNFASLNKGRQLYSAGRPSCWALAHISSLWSPYVIGQTIYIFILSFVLYGRPLVCFYLSIFFYSSPNLSRRRLDVYHTSTHGVALVRI